MNNRLMKKPNLLRCTLRSLVRRIDSIRLRGRLRAPRILGFLISLFLFPYLFFFNAEAVAMGKKPSQVEIGLKAPDFLYQNEGGGATSFSQFRATAANKITVICFLSYDCPFSRLALKSASNFFEENKANVAAVGVSPMPYETQELLAKYRQEEKIPFDLYWDESGELTCLFHVWRVPEFFVYDQQGVLQFRGGLDGMKIAVTALTKGESGFSSESNLLGCSVPKRQYQPPKKTVKKEIKKEEKKPVGPDNLALIIPNSAQQKDSSKTENFSHCL